MAVLETKTTVLFEPSLYRELKRIAATRRTSVGHLIRTAVAEKYGLGGRDERVAAARRLAAMSAPVDDWEKMEAEILRGALG